MEKFPEIFKNVSIPKEHASQDVLLPIRSKQGIRNYYNNCYLSVVIQSIIDTKLYKFFQSELEAPTNIVQALWICRNMLCCGENQWVVNLRDDIFERYDVSELKW